VAFRYGSSNPQAPLIVSARSGSTVSLKPSSFTDQWQRMETCWSRTKSVSILMLSSNFVLIAILAVLHQARIRSAPQNGLWNAVISHGPCRASHRYFPFLTQEKNHGTDCASGGCRPWEYQVH
jgi:hypothetical protein